MSWCIQIFRAVVHTNLIIRDSSRHYAVIIERYELYDTAHHSVPTCNLRKCNYLILSSESCRTYIAARPSNLFYNRDGFVNAKVAISEVRMYEIAIDD